MPWRRPFCAERERGPLEGAEPRFLVTVASLPGELSLTGKVMPVGGIKEKVIAARRADIHTICLPADNRRDFDELPDYLKDGLTPHFADHYDDVAALAFPGAAL